MKIFFTVAVTAAAAFIIWLYMIAPRCVHRPDFGEFKKYYYAHRGLYSADQTVPENSLAAFSLAVERGFGMELDLQLTEDGVIVIHHDENISRMCGADKIISQMTFEELSAYRLNNTQEKIPTFGELLALVGGKTPLIIELKAYDNYAKLCETALNMLRGYDGLFCVESFSPYSVLWFRRHAPDIIRGQLMNPYNKRGQTKIKNGFTAWALRNMLTNFIVRPDFEAYHIGGRHTVSLRLARRVFGMQEVSWTVRDEATFAQCEKEGCLVIFEHMQPPV